MLNPVTRGRLRPQLLVALSLSVLAAPVALTGCAPRETTPSRVVASTNAEQAAFYPAQAGLSWTYLPEGETLGSPLYTLTAQGPTLFGDQPALAFRFTGRGADQVSYRQVSDEGQLLYGFSKPGLTVALSPALREYPPAGAWRPGLSWSGASNVRVISDGKIVREGQVQYRYTVLEKRSVTLNGETHEVWVVNRQITGDVASLFPETSQNLWFAPYLGEIRTPEGLLQIGRNYSGGR